MLNNYSLPFKLIHGFIDLKIYIDLNGRLYLYNITFGVVFVQFHWLNQSHDIQNIEVY